MRIGTIALALSAVSAAAAYDHPNKVRRGEKPDGKVAPGTTDQCTYYFTTSSQDDTCSFIEGYWGISHANFVAWVRTASRHVQARLRARRLTSNMLPTLLLCTESRRQG